MLKTMLDFRKDHLELNNEHVKQLCVIGVAVERFWEIAFHDMLPRVRL